MLVGGGLYDQPVEWFHAQQARFWSDFLDKIANPETKLGSLAGDEATLYLEVMDIRAKQRQNA